MKILLLLMLALAYLSSCTNPPLRGEDVLGAEEFVMDSFKIREGKFAILELEGKDFEELPVSHLNEYTDHIHNGDMLKVAIHHPSRKDLSDAIQSIGNQIGYRVVNGQIQLPDLPPIHVAGLTLEEAQQEIQNEYRKEIKDVEVYVTFQERSERKVELAGLVSIPSFPVNGKVRLFDVLAEARVPTNANFFKSYVLRQNMLLPVDLYKLVKEGDMTQNIVMQGGDKIYIAEPQATNLMVLGEVGKQQVLDLPNGFMPLPQALAAAGGIAVTGDRSYIQVIRGNILHPKIYTLNWEHIIRLRSDSLLLIPGDIVYVAARPLTEWSRFVNDILPTIVGIELISKGAKNVGIVVD